jgi:hypothetical protein
VSTKQQKGNKMKTLTKVTLIALTLGTTSLFATTNDYAITNNYKLLNDMKFAKKQQELILNMSQALESNIVDMKSLNISKEKFSKVLLGLANGNDSINLKGTDIPTIKTKLSEIQTLWTKELAILNNITSKNNKEKAIDGLNSIMTKMSQAVALYNKSYSKFKQKSKLSSLVAHHMNSKHRKTFAFNIVQ